jgi:hypothetical protein
MDIGKQERVITVEPLEVQPTIDPEHEQIPVEPTIDDLSGRTGTTKHH